jgi:general secretion pathway protein H
MSGGNIARKRAASRPRLHLAARREPANVRIAENGWSLIEMLVVLAILALIAAVALPGTPIMGRGPSLGLVAADMAARLRAARSLAMAQDRDVVFALDTDRRTYGVAGVGASQTIPATIGLSVTTARTLIRENKEAQLVFFSDGTSSGGTVRLTDQHQSVAIGVEWLTGAVHIERGAP